MSNSPAPQTIEEWLQIARKDFARIKRNLRDGDAEASGFYLQQALEKYLKAFLLQRGWRLKKIHELHTLLDDAVQYVPALDQFSALCERVSGYYRADRYPPLGLFELTCEDVEGDIAAALSFIRALFPQEAPGS